MKIIIIIIIIIVITIIIVIIIYLSRDSAVSTATRVQAGRSRVQVPVEARYFFLLQNGQTGSGAHPTGQYMKNCKHFCTSLEDKSLNTCAPFIVCLRTAALSMYSLHPLHHIVTAAVIWDVIKKSKVAGTLRSLTFT